jgi:hypothetical protein
MRHSRTISDLIDSSQVMHGLLHSAVCLSVFLEFYKEIINDHSLGGLWTNTVLILSVLLVPLLGLQLANSTISSFRFTSPLVIGSAFYIFARVTAEFEERRNDKKHGDLHDVPRWFIGPKSSILWGVLLLTSLFWGPISLLQVARGEQGRARGLVAFSSFVVFFFYIALGTFGALLYPFEWNETGTKTMLAICLLSLAAYPLGVDRARSSLLGILDRRQADRFFLSRNPSPVRGPVNASTPLLPRSRGGREMLFSFATFLCVVIVYALTLGVRLDTLAWMFGFASISQWPITLAL